MRQKCKVKTKRVDKGKPGTMNTNRKLNKGKEKETEKRAEQQNKVNFSRHINYQYTQQLTR